jgi:hypothetical protein
MLLNPKASFDLAVRLRSSRGAPLGEVFAFLSGLYFRGKLAYANRFAAPPRGLRGCYVITSDSGLALCDKRVTVAKLQRYSATSIDLAEARYREPLVHTASVVGKRLPRSSQVVLLGSIATGKYVDILQESFGDRLVFPKDFIGRGDMSRGGLLLRCVSTGTELEYIQLGAVQERTGKRPPKLAPATRKHKEARDA